MTNKKLSIDFIQPAFGKYRKPLFDRMNEEHDVKFHFLNEVRPGKANSVPDTLNHTTYQNNSLETLKNVVGNVYKSDSDVVVTSITDRNHTVLFQFLSNLSLIDQPVVLWSEEWRQRIGGNIRTAVKKKLSEFVVGCSDALLLPSESYFSYFQNMGVEIEKVFYVSQCSLDYADYQHENLRDEVGINNEIVFLYLGNIIKRKGLDILIKSFNKLERTIGKEVSLLVVGDGQFRDQCEDLCNKLSVSNVHFTGRVSESRIPSYYHISDVYVLPSCLRSHYEPCPIAVHEAMSMSLPVITTDAVGSSGWMVKNNSNGFVVQENNVSELHKAMEKLSSSLELRNRMGCQSRRLFDFHNNYKYMYEQFIEAIRYAIKNR